MMGTRRTTWAAALLWLATTVRSTYILLESKSQCFSIEQPQYTYMTVKYEIPSLEEMRGDEADHAKSVLMTLADRRNEKVVLSKTIASHQGEIELSTKGESVHNLCFKKQKHGTGDKSLRFDFEINVGLSDRSYDARAVENKMDKLEIEVTKLKDELAEILSEADYMKEKEVKFHTKAERINLAAIWWPIIQLAILIFTALISVRNLKNFFSAKNFY